MKHESTAIPSNQEIWLPIPNFEGHYEASTKGRIKSIKRYYLTGLTYRKQLQKEIVLSPSKDKDGYKRVKLHKEGKKFYMRVNRIIALTFMQNPNNLPVVMHIDNDVKNNNVKNLKWGTHAENIRQTVVENRRPQKKILQFTPNGELIKEWPSRTELRRNGFRPIDSFLHDGRLHKGFLWKWG